LSYTVRWSHRALDSLARLWLENPDHRASITEAVAAAEELFAVDPVHEGESREEDRRVVFMRPLVFTVSIDESRSVVRVLNVRHPKWRGHR
jgi:ParE toxin of type II toxin-antitoxin system, parDE